MYKNAVTDRKKSAIDKDARAMDKTERRNLGIYVFQADRGFIPGELATTPSISSSCIT